MHPKSVPGLPEIELPGIGVAIGWLSGLLLLGVIVGFALHFGDVQVFLSTLRSANPLWLAVAVACQIATYACAAAVWFRIFSRTEARQSFAGLFKLAVVQLFANQALPSGGFSGTVIVAKGLARRGVAPSLVMTALLVDGFSYYASYLMVGLLAFVILWHSSDLGTAWLPLATAFVLVLLALVLATFLLIRRQGRIIPKATLRWAPAAKMAAILGSARTDMLRDGKLILEAFFLQIGVFLLDAATLWIAARSVGLAVGPIDAFLSFVLASVVATLSPIPLGLGTFEGTCTGLLHVMGSGIEASLAATLILRGFTLWLPMVPGLWLMRSEMDETALHDTDL
ncbi:MAG: flippase-like domain-containing protein [Mesorhizobium sp.]|uniref:lysylphosphatidylglycerol synthase transmembrane domain-containing protein n=1 Tax=Mesorhizobium sp. TaxID=1871066 RepID=UPI000FE996D7|nr:lysylphosphatidylglycerol synthase transmembrane domain-containing protein [Mesorhizobium sp.]RWM04395.1 MAG: flippase-like domain-containing protein [Mesorhizobium sp.]TIO50156.1 MAG: flippase-like domain-containing protein [Mesorhizobium sp.]TIO57294.1 MAG: flippase-like domain-containing protein [Mesorhizobium sp.]TJV61796.1 MAG: flippase-like domain-containing protein [Mesorhizobium sp.]